MRNVKSERLALLRIGCVCLLAGCGSTGDNTRSDAAHASDAGLDADPSSSDAALDSSATDASLTDAESTDASQTDGAETPTVIAAGERRPADLAVYGNEVFWITQWDVETHFSSGAVRKAPIAGGAVQILKANEDSPTALAVGLGFAGEPTVFWTDGAVLGKVKQIAADGTLPVTSSELDDVLDDIVLEGDSVFVGGRSSLYSKGLASSQSPTTISSPYGNGVVKVAADAAAVVFGARTYPDNDWIIAALKRVDNSVTTLYTGTNAIGCLTISATHVYWSENDTGELHRATRAGGDHEVLKTFDGLETPADCVVIEPLVYVATHEWTLSPSGATGRILSIHTTTRAERVYATNQAQPCSLAVEDNHIYWANRGLASDDGAISRITQ
jgi:hypothetical protein